MLIGSSVFDIQCITNATMMGPTEMSIAWKKGNLVFSMDIAKSTNSRKVMNMYMKE